MKTLPRLFISERNLDFLTEVEKVDTIAREIQSVEIDPFKLIYCGIEGCTILSSGQLPYRKKTFGMTYDLFKGIAHDIDYYGSAVEDNPLQYALYAEKTPAMVAYDENKLMESRHSPDVWLPKKGFTLEEAANVVIFFVDEI